MSILGNLIGGVFSMFSANKQRQQAKEDAANKFVDLRAAAIAGGFNPLTALQATGGAGFGAYPTSAPPLASIELLTGAANGVVEELSGAAKLRRATDVLNYDLAKLQLEQARSGVLVYQGGSAVGPMGGPFSKQPAQHVSSGEYTDENFDAATRAELARAGASEYEQRLEPIDLFVPYRLRDGTIAFGPNPNIPEFDQFASAGTLFAAGEAKQAVGLYGEQTPPLAIPPFAAPVYSGRGNFGMPRPLSAGSLGFN